MSTASKITNLLNRRAMTVNELSIELGISRNSAHQQIAKLEAQGAIRKCEQRMATTAGKPAWQYRTVAGREDEFSLAYKPLIDVLMETLKTDLPESKRLALLEKTGRSLARAAGLQPGTNTRDNIQKSVDVVNSLGAMAEFTSSKKESHISCFSCPVATLVHKEPLTCKMVAAFFSEATGKDVTVRCRKDESVVCGFTLE